MILVITNTNDKTVDYLINRMDKECFRFDTDKFLSQYDVSYTPDYISIINSCTDQKIDNLTISGVIYRRPVNPICVIDNNIEVSKELSLESRYIYENIISMFDTKWMSKPNKVRLAENKLLQLQKAKNCGFKIPTTIVTNSSKSFWNIYNPNKKYCIKPIIMGVFQHEGNNFVPYNSTININDDIDKVDNFPCLIQEYIEKEYELRVIVVGDKIFASKIDSQSNENTKEDWRVNNCMAVDYFRYDLPEVIKHQCKKIVNIFDLSFSSMDLIKDKSGNYIFLDLNPNGQWAWIDEILNLNISVEIGKYFNE